MSDYSDEIEVSDEELIKPISTATYDDQESDLFPSLPEKSKERYICTYNAFIEWKATKNISDFSEDVFLEYFTQLSKVKKPPTLWSVYSMIRGTVRIKDKVDISSYRRLVGFLKKLSKGYIRKKTKALTADQITTFLKDAPDSVYLATKVVLILGISGACNREELYNLTTNDIDDRDSVMLIKIPGRKNAKSRSFAITGDFYRICKKYLLLRPPITDHNKFFTSYQKGKCKKQQMGIHKLGGTLREIAIYLDLPNPDEYTGHGFRKSSDIVPVNSEADLKTRPIQEGNKILKKIPSDPIEIVSQAVLHTSIDNDSDENCENLLNASPRIVVNPADENNKSSDTNIESAKNITLEIVGSNVTVNLNFTNCSNISLHVKEKTT